MQRTFLIFLFIGLCTYTLSQKVSDVKLTFNKTVHMFFPSNIRYYDVGSNDILVQKIDAMLKLAPKSNRFIETNLTVITEDNTCYLFLLKYNSDINVLTYFIGDSLGRKFGNTVKPQNTSADTLKTTIDNTDAEYNQVSRGIIKKAPAYWIAATQKKVYLSINNIYVHNDKLFFVLSVGNASNINYDVNYLKFYVADKKKLKKASHQEIEKVPIYSFNFTDIIQAKTKEHSIIFVFDKFTIDGDKKLVMELGEQGGGRNIYIDITQDLIIKAEAI